MLLEPPWIDHTNSNLNTIYFINNIPYLNISERFGNNGDKLKFGLTGRFINRKIVENLISRM